MSQQLGYESPPADGPALPGARLAVTLLLGINLLNYIDRQVLAAVEDSISKTFYGTAEHAGTFQLGKMGLLGTAFIVSYMVTAPIFGALSDRMSRWKLVGIGVLLWSLATAASGWASGYAVLLVTRLFVGVGEAGYGPAAPTIISDMYPVKRRGQVLAWFYVAIPIGSALGYVVGELTDKTLGWRWAFYIAAIPGLILGVVSLSMRDPPRGRADGASGHGLPKWVDYRKLLSNRSFVLNTLAMAAMTFAIGGIGFWMPRYLADYRHLGGAPKTIFGGITVAAGLAATLTGGWLGDKLRPRFGGSYFLVSGFGILAACPFVVAMLYLPFPYAWGAVFGAVFFLFFNTGPSNTALANVVHPSIRASAFAVNIFVIHALGDAPSFPVLGAVAERFGWNAAFGLVVTTMIVAGVLWLGGAPHLARDTEAAPNRE